MDASNNAIGWGLTALLVGSTLNVVGDCFLIATEEQRKEMRPGWHGFACLLGLAAGALYYASADAQSRLSESHRKVVMWSMRWVGYIAGTLFACSSTMAIGLDVASVSNDTATTSAPLSLLQDIVDAQTQLFYMLFALGAVGLVGCYGTMAYDIVLKKSRLPLWSVFLNPLVVMILQQIVMIYYSLWLPLQSPALGVFVFAVFVLIWWMTVGRYIRGGYQEITS